jgi:hypothetical protein
MEDINMTFAELTREERQEITQRIQAIIGKKEESIREGMSISERVKARSDYDKQFDKLAKIYVQYGAEALACNFEDCGAFKKGVTTQGKKWSLEMNGGYTQRSRYCGSLYIEGEGMIFTSGTLAKAFEYIFTH